MLNLKNIFEYGLETDIEIAKQLVTVSYTSKNGVVKDILQVSGMPAEWFVEQTLANIKVLVEEEHKKMRDYLMISTLSTL